MKVRLRAAGNQPPPDMRPGEYIARCERGEISVRGNKISAVLTFTVLGKFTAHGFEQANDAVALCQWYGLGENDPGDDMVTLEVKPYSKYGQAWAKAMSRPLKRTDDPDPKAFQKKVFKVNVGYRSNLDGNFSYKNTGRPKDPKDFLRIHLIVEKIDEKALIHMGPLEHMAPVTYDTEHRAEAFPNRNNKDFSESLSSSSSGIGLVEIDFRVAPSMANERTGLGHAKPEAGQLTQDSPAPPGTIVDDGGFDWQDGIQHDGGVEFVSGNGEIKQARSVDEVWREIKAEHKARRARGH